jgi:glycosyltransferase involved in cell wall biosynthesis
MSESRLSLLYLQPAPLFGGAERQAVEQASYLRRFGIDTTVVAGPGIAIIDWLRREHVENVIRSRNFPGRWPKQKGIRKLTLPFRVVHCGLDAREEFEELLARRAFDLVLASLPFAWVTGALVARRHGLPIVWRAGGGYINPVQAAGMWSITRFLRPDLFVCNSEAVKRTFAPVVPAPIRIVPNGVDMAVFNPEAGDARRFRPRDAEIVVGFAGRLATSKRPEDVVAMAARLRRSHPAARVLIAGEGSRRGEYETLARTLGADNVEFLGYVADMPSFYAACDIVVLPSSSEGFSNAVLEAMASGKAVVASEIPSLVEQIEDRVTGLVYPLGDVAAFTQAVEWLIENPGLRRRIEERALERAKGYSVLAAAERLSILLKELVPPKRPEQVVLRSSPPVRSRVTGSLPRAAE